MKELLKKLSVGERLTAEEAFYLFELLVSSSKVTDAQIGAFLFALGGARIPTSAELTGAARALRKHMVRVPAKSAFPGEVIIDTCGTGGSGFNTFNTSTICAIIAAAAGVKVAKHGNRAATSQCGSADLISALGIQLEMKPEQALECLRKSNFCFLFAPNHHPATKRVQLIRRELGFRTIFNFLGPLVNPAEVEYQLLGVSNKEMVPVIAETLLTLGTQHALVVCGEDNFDEISLSAETLVAEVKNGNIGSYRLKPEDFGFSRVNFKDIQGADPAASARLVKELLAGKDDARRNLVLLNAGAILYIGKKAKDINEGITLAAELIASGKALSALDTITKLTIK